VTPPDEEILIVSDLHLSAGREGPGASPVRDRAAAFASFVRSLASDASFGTNEPRPARRLVLLGDTLDLPTHVSDSNADPMGRWRIAATAAVERIADAQPEPFDALAAFVAAGDRLELLPGNHDVALQMPDVRRALLGRLGDASGAVGWHPWILHLPGLLWAEHGGQHHDLHAIPEWLSPGASRSSWGLPPGRAIEALSVTATRDRRPSRELTNAVASLVADAIASTVARPALARRRRAYRARDLPACAADLELPEPLLVAVDRLTETDGWSIAARLIRRRLAGGDASPASFLGLAARRVHAILAAGGRDVRIYAFGHTHAPAVLPLEPSARGAWFANAGSWAGIRPAALRRRIGADRYPFVRIQAAAGRDPTVELNHWNAAREQVEPFPG
jgi:UDP-2,3-diacylglucosamine pyrophosphatase LpxH